MVCDRKTDFERHALDHVRLSGRGYRDLKINGLSRAAWFIGGLLLSLCWLPTIAAEENSSTDIDAIIQRLGSRTFREREAAMAEILEIGPAALPALRRHQEADDAELKKRVEIISQRLMNDDFEARIEAFLEGKEDATLPGWNYFKTRVGARLRHREVFVELSRRHRAAATLLDGTADDRLEAYRLIASSFGPVIKDLSFADAIALLALSADESIQPTPEGDRIIRMLFNYYEVRNTANETEFSQPVRTLMNRYITKVDESSWFYAISMADQWNLDTSSELAKQILIKSNNVELVLMTFQMLARLGKPQDSLLVKRFLDDKLVLDQGNFYTDEAGRRLQLRLSDVAMATIGKLNKKSLRDLGFPAARENNQGFFEIASVGFPIGEPGEEARKRVRSDIDELLNELESKAEKE